MEAEQGSVRVEIQVAARDSNTRKVVSQMGKRHKWVAADISTSRQLLSVAMIVLRNLGVEANHQLILYPDIKVHTHLKNTPISWGPNFDATLPLRDIHKIFGCPAKLHFLYHLIAPEALSPAGKTPNRAEMQQGSGPEQQLKPRQLDFACRMPGQQQQQQLVAQPLLQQVQPMAQQPPVSQALTSAPDVAVAWLATGDWQGQQQVSRAGWQEQQQQAPPWLQQQRQQQQQANIMAPPASAGGHYVSGPGRHTEHVSQQQQQHQLPLRPLQDNMQSSWYQTNRQQAQQTQLPGSLQTCSSLNADLACNGLPQLSLPLVQQAPTLCMPQQVQAMMAPNVRQQQRMQLIMQQPSLPNQQQQPWLQHGNSQTQPQQQMQLAVLQPQGPASGLQNGILGSQHLHAQQQPNSTGGTAANDFPEQQLLQQQQQAYVNQEQQTQQPLQGFQGQAAAGQSGIANQVTCGAVPCLSHQSSQYSCGHVQQQQVYQLQAQQPGSTAGHGAQQQPQQQHNAQLAWQDQQQLGNAVMHSSTAGGSPFPPVGSTVAGAGCAMKEQTAIGFSQLPATTGHMQAASQQQKQQKSNSSSDLQAQQAPLAAPATGLAREPTPAAGDALTVRLAVQSADGRVVEVPVVCSNDGGRLVLRADPGLEQQIHQQLQQQLQQGVQPSIQLLAILQALQSAAAQTAASNAVGIVPANAAGAEGTMMQTHSQITSAPNIAHQQDYQKQGHPFEQQQQQQVQHTAPACHQQQHSATCQENQQQRQQHLQHMRPVQQQQQQQFQQKQQVQGQQHGPHALVLPVHQQEQAVPFLAQDNQQLHDATRCQGHDHLQQNNNCLPSAHQTAHKFGSNLEVNAEHLQQLQQHQGLISVRKVQSYSVAAAVSAAALSGVAAVSSAAGTSIAASPALADQTGAAAVSSPAAELRSHCSSVSCGGGAGTDARPLVKLSRMATINSSDAVAGSAPGMDQQLAVSGNPYVPEVGGSATRNPQRRIVDFPGSTAEEGKHLEQHARSAEAGRGVLQPRQLHLQAQECHPQAVQQWHPQLQSIFEQEGSRDSVPSATPAAGAGAATNAAVQAMQATPVTAEAGVSPALELRLESDAAADVADGNQGSDATGADAAAGAATQPEQQDHQPQAVAGPTASNNDDDDAVGGYADGYCDDDLDSPSPAMPPAGQHDTQQQQSQQQASIQQLSQQEQRLHDCVGQARAADVQMQAQALQAQQQPTCLGTVAAGSSKAADVPDNRHISQHTCGQMQPVGFSNSISIHKYAATPTGISFGMQPPAKRPVNSKSSSKSGTKKRFKGGSVSSSLYSNYYQYAPGQFPRLAANLRLPAEQELGLPSIISSGASCKGTWHSSTHAWDNRVEQTPIKPGELGVGSIFSVAELLKQSEQQQQQVVCPVRSDSKGNSSNKRVAAGQPADASRLNKQIRPSNRQTAAAVAQRRLQKQQSSLSQQQSQPVDMETDAMSAGAVCSQPGSTSLGGWCDGTAAAATAVCGNGHLSSHLTMAAGQATGTSVNDGTCSEPAGATEADGGSGKSAAGPPAVQDMLCSTNAAAGGAQTATSSRDNNQHGPATLFRPSSEQQPQDKQQQQHQWPGFQANLAPAEGATPECLEEQPAVDTSVAAAGNDVVQQQGDVVERVHDDVDLEMAGLDDILNAQSLADLEQAQERQRHRQQQQHACSAATAEMPGASGGGITMHGALKAAGIIPPSPILANAAQQEKGAPHVDQTQQHMQQVQQGSERADANTIMSYQQLLQLDAPQQLGIEQQQQEVLDACYHVAASAGAALAEDGLLMCHVEPHQCPEGAAAAGVQLSGSSSGAGSGPTPTGTQTRRNTAHNTLEVPALSGECWSTGEDRQQAAGTTNSTEQSAKSKKSKGRLSGGGGRVKPQAKCRVPLPSVEQLLAAPPLPAAPAPGSTSRAPLPPPSTLPQQQGAASGQPPMAAVAATAAPSGALQRVTLPDGSTVYVAAAKPGTASNSRHKPQQPQQQQLPPLTLLPALPLLGAQQLPVLAQQALQQQQQLLQVQALQMQQVLQQAQQQKKPQQQQQMLKMCKGAGPLGSAAATAGGAFTGVANQVLQVAAAVNGQNVQLPLGAVPPAQLTAALNRVAAATGAQGAAAAATASTPTAANVSAGACAAVPVSHAAMRPSSGLPLSGLITPGFLSPTGLMSPSAPGTTGAAVAGAMNTMTVDCLEALLSDKDLSFLSPEKSMLMFNNNSTLGGLMSCLASPANFLCSPAPAAAQQGNCTAGSQQQQPPAAGSAPASVSGTVTATAAAAGAANCTNGADFQSLFQAFRDSSGTAAAASVADTGVELPAAAAQGSGCNAAAPASGVVPVPADQSQHQEEDLCQYLLAGGNDSWLVPPAAAAAAMAAAGMGTAAPVGANANAPVDGGQPGCTTEDSKRADTHRKTAASKGNGKGGCSAAETAAAAAAAAQPTRKSARIRAGQTGQKSGAGALQQPAAAGNAARQQQQQGETFDPDKPFAALFPASSTATS